jgi:myosin-1
VRVRRAGFAFRAPFARFLRRYKMLSAQTWPTWKDDDIKGCRTILRELNMVEGAQFQMGRTKVFIRQPVSLFTIEGIQLSSPLHHTHTIADYGNFHRNA